MKDPGFGKFSSLTQGHPPKLGGPWPPTGKAVPFGATRFSPRCPPRPGPLVASGPRQVTTQPASHPSQRSPHRPPPSTGAWLELVLPPAQPGLVLKGLSSHRAAIRPWAAFTWAPRHGGREGPVSRLLPPAHALPHLIAEAHTVVTATHMHAGGPVSSWSPACPDGLTGGRQAPALSPWSFQQQPNLQEREERGSVTLLGCSSI